MKKQITIILSALALALTFSALLSSCYTPNPLYGKWMDNDGNSITFQAEGEFSASIATTVDSNGDPVPTNYTGTYTVIDNTITYTYESSTGNTASKITTWDVTGAILYITWSDNGTQKALMLYHVSR